MIYIRSLVFNIICYGIILAGSILTCTVGLLLPRLIIRAFWGRYALVLIRASLKHICGLEIELRGRENIQNTPALYACKHQSAAETYFLASYVLYSTFVFKKELSHIPFFGWAFRRYGSVPVDRGGGSRAMKNMLENVKKVLHTGLSVIIFPEGTRTQPGKSAPYKAGIAFLYQNTDCPVVPVATNTGFFWKKNSFLRHPGKIIFEFMPPMPRGLDKKAFMAELKNRIETKCNELNRETIKNYPGLTEMLK